MIMSPVRRTILVGTLLLLVLAAVLWFFVLSPRLATASEIEAETQNVATSNLSLQARYNQALEQARQAPQSAKEAVALFETMPQEADIPDVLKQVTQAAQDAGIPADQVTSVRTTIPTPVVNNPKPASSGSTSSGTAGRVQLATIGLELTASGKRAELLAFLDNLRQLDRAVLVKSTGLVTTPDGADALTVDADLFVLQSQLPDLVAEVQDLLAAASLPDGVSSPAASPGPTSSPAG
jgi:hypothetical protein